MSLNSIKGQDQASSNIKKLIEMDRFPHSLLIMGPSGTGKKFATVQIAKALICSEKKHDSCDICADCQRIEKGTHPDVTAIDKADGKSIKIDFVRKLREQISLKPYEADKKVFLIHDIQDMTEAASNALLKTLEEPQAASFLILTANNDGIILPTILSRCQRINFNSLSEKATGEILLSQGISEEKAKVAVGIMDADLTWIIEHADTIYELREKFFKALFSKSSNAFLAAIGKNRANLKEDDLIIYMKVALSIFRDSIVVKSSPQGIINFDKLSEIKKIAALFSDEAFLEAAQKVNKLINFRDNNLNLKLVWDSFFSQMNSFSLKKNLIFV